VIALELCYYNNDDMMGKEFVLPFKLITNVFSLHINTITLL
jgi:hypothetical protein